MIRIKTTKKPSIIVFQKLCAFLSSINENATKPNLTADRIKTKNTPIFESIKLETIAAVIVNRTSTSNVYEIVFTIFLLQKIKYKIGNNSSQIKSHICQKAALASTSSIFTSEPFFFNPWYTEPRITKPTST